MKTCICVALTCCFFYGCTIAPKGVPSAVASFDGGAQNSGVLYAATNAGIPGFVITPTARARYNSLVAVYASKFHPPLATDQGLVDLKTNAWFMSNQAMVDFGLMSYRWRSGK